MSRPLPNYLLRNDGHGLDDIDIALTRHRTRHVSSASGTTFKSAFSDDAVADEEPVKKANSVKPRSSAGRSPGPNTAALYRRGRTASSIGCSHIGLDSPLSTQHTLEAVVSSRLFETFVTISLPLDATNEGYDVQCHSYSPACVSYAHRNIPTIKPNHTPSPARGLTKYGSPRSNLPRGCEQAHPGPSQSSLSFPSASKTVVEEAVYDEVPCYISSIHSSSTNPSWTSLSPEDDFSSDANPGATRLELTLWGCRTHPYSTPGTRCALLTSLPYYAPC